MNASAMVPRTTILSIIAALTLLPGCKSEAPETKATPAQPNHGGHVHERDKMLLIDAGRYHAALTAHLAPSGNELDIFFETQSGKPPRPVALTIESFTAQVKTASGKIEKLEFTPAPPEERKGDKPGTCSHFVAKAPWMKPDDNLYVTATVSIDGKEEVLRWRDFNPKKFAHHEE